MNFEKEAVRFQNRIPFRAPAFARRANTFPHRSSRRSVQVEVYLAVPIEGYKKFVDESDAIERAIDGAIGVEREASQESATLVEGKRICHSTSYPPSE